MLVAVAVNRVNTPNTTVATSSTRLRPMRSATKPSAKLPSVRPARAALNTRPKVCGATCSMSIMAGAARPIDCRSRPSSNATTPHSRMMLICARPTGRCSIMAVTSMAAVSATGVLRFARRHARNRRPLSSRHPFPCRSPTMDDAVATLTAELVVANHILFHQGVVDGFGHVSARHPARPGHFLMARSMAPALVQASDILELDQDGEPVVAGGPAVYLERFIHSEIYRVRADVMGVVHSHSPSVVPFQRGAQHDAAPDRPHLRLSRHPHADLRNPRMRRRGQRPAGPRPPAGRGAGAVARRRVRGADARAWLDGGGGFATARGSPRGLYRVGGAVAVAGAAAGAGHLSERGARRRPPPPPTMGHVNRAWALWQKLAEQNQLA